MRKATPEILPAPILTHREPIISWFQIRQVVRILTSISTVRFRLLRPSSLANALCNPLNGCVEEGVPSLFMFEDGFQDMDIVIGTNSGCWVGTGFEPDFYWFTIEAQADGPLGFVFESPDPSDIDFNDGARLRRNRFVKIPGRSLTSLQTTNPFVPLIRVGFCPPAWRIFILRPA